MKKIFLFGHRREHGKDTCVSILKSLLDDKKITHHHTYFAKLLKEHACLKYGLDIRLINDADYKKSKPEHLNGLTVRDVLIKEGCNARAIYTNTWSLPVYKELLESDAQIGIISDFRFHNEYDSFNECMSLTFPHYDIFDDIKLIKVLVHRKDGSFLADGADDQLPDLGDYWDHIILNNGSKENWYKHLCVQVNNMVELEFEG